MEKIKISISLLLTCILLLAINVGCMTIEKKVAHKFPANTGLTELYFAELSPNNSTREESAMLLQIINNYEGNYIDWYSMDLPEKMRLLLFSEAVRTPDVSTPHPFFYQDFSEEFNGIYFAAYGESYKNRQGGLSAIFYLLTEKEGTIIPVFAAPDNKGLPSTSPYSQEILITRGIHEGFLDISCVDIAGHLFMKLSTISIESRHVDMYYGVVDNEYPTLELVFITIDGQFNSDCAYLLNYFDTQQKGYLGTFPSWLVAPTYNTPRMTSPEIHERLVSSDVNLVSSTLVAIGSILTNLDSIEDINIRSDFISIIKSNRKEIVELTESRNTWISAAASIVVQNLDGLTAR